MDNKKESTEHHEPNEENLVQDLKKWNNVLSK